MANAKKKVRRNLLDRFRSKLQKKRGYQSSNPAEKSVHKVGDSRVCIGRFTYGHRHMKVHEWGEGANLTIGSFCSIAAGFEVYLGGNHQTGWVSTFPFGHVYQEQLGVHNIADTGVSNGDVVIGHDVWIGTDVRVMSGVTVGHGAVLAANANIVKDVPPYAIVGGNPAKLLRYRFAPEIIEALLALAWWNLPSQQIKVIVPMLSGAPNVEVIAEIKDRLASR
jgi:acetyltransferase-like isoleucine patch superfamily enzyme